YTITVTPTTNTTYTLTSVSNACGTITTNTNNSAVVTLTPQTIATSSITGSPFCLGAKVNVAYTATGVIKTGNVFTAQLSNATGSFATGVTTIGTLSSTLSTGTIATTLPSNATAGTAYRIRVISSSPAINGTDNGVNLAINALPTATLAGTQTIVSSNSAKLTVNLTGSSPWSVVVNGQTYSNITASPYTITVTPTANTTYTLTSVSNACGTITTNTNNSAVVTLTPQTIATSSITGSPFCLGAKVNVAYTATGVIKTGNVFTAQLSNATGSFATGVTTIGTLTSTLSTGTIATTLPSNATAGTAYRIRVISSSPAINGTDNGVNLAINGQPTATLAGTQSIVSSNSAKLTVNLTGSSPWSVVVNGQTYSNITASPYTITVTPTTNTTYTLTSVSNACGTVNVTAGNTATVTLTPQTMGSDPRFLTNPLIITNKRISDTLDTPKTSTIDYEHLEFKIYPNPSEGLVKIDYPSNTEEGIIIHLRSIDGKEIQKINEKAKRGDNTFQLTVLSSGIYFIVLQSDSGIKMEKKVQILK
ncbi:T9SS type A sorting domain-containing protein, partial [Arcicella lustrica]